MSWRDLPEPPQEIGLRGAVRRFLWFLRAYGRAIWRHRVELMALGVLLGCFTLLAAAAAYVAERGAGTFGSFWDAVYWAGITMTTVGYGDVTPRTTAGEAIALITAFVGAGFLLVTTGLVAVFFARLLER